MQFRFPPPLPTSSPLKTNWQYSRVGIFIWATCDLPRRGAACCAPTTKDHDNGSGFGEDASVVVFVGGDDVVGAEFFLGVDAGGLAHFTHQIEITGGSAMARQF